MKNETYNKIESILMDLFVWTVIYIMLLFANWCFWLWYSFSFNHLVWTLFIIDALEILYARIVLKNKNK